MKKSRQIIFNTIIIAYLGIITFFLAYGHFHAPRREYKEARFDNALKVPRLNELGAEGWELISISCDMFRCKALMKREGGGQ